MYLLEARPDELIVKPNTSIKMKRGDFAEGVKKIVALFMDSPFTVAEVGGYNYKRDTQFVYYSNIVLRKLGIESVKFVSRNGKAFIIKKGE